MEHYAHTVPGWFDQGDMAFYKMIVDHAPRLAHFVEVGSYKGRSSSYLAVEIIRSGKSIILDCVDTWLGSPENQRGAPAEDPDVVEGRLLDVFMQNMAPVQGYFNAVQATSEQAARRYANKTLDLVFIDASHDYDSVLADIRMWSPKIKSGGFLAGHDIAHEPVRRAIAATLGQAQVMHNCWFRQAR